MEKKENQKRKTRLFRFLILFIVVILGGIASFIWFSINIDYQDNTNPSYDGYHFLSVKLDLVTLDFQKKHKTLMDGSQVKGEFSEHMIDSVVQNMGIKYPVPRPVFHLINRDNKQTIYRVKANLSSVKHIKKVEFATFGELNGQNDLKLYQGVYQPESDTWESDIIVKNHQEVGRYQIKLLITKENGKTELVEFGEFIVEQPTIEAEIDRSKVGKGQFDVNIKTKSVATIEKVKVSVWHKEDQSDKKIYEGIRQMDNTYNVHIDYEDFDFNNGVYHVNSELTATNGLTAKGEESTVAIDLNRPIRIRIMQETTLFQDRTLSKVAKQLPTNSIAYVKGIAFNSENKIYRTTEGYISADNSEINEMMDDIRYVAHRGNHKVAPENSIPAFQQSDSWGIETDIWLTKDKQWVIMHDKTIDRMTNGKGKIKDLTLAQINLFHIDQGANKQNYSEDQLVIPTLEDFLTIINNKKSIPFIEIKAKNLESSDYDSLANLISAYGMANTAVIISFDYPNLIEMKKRLPDTQVQFLATTLDEQMIDQVSTLGENAGLAIKYDRVVDRADLIAKAQSKGLSVNLWGVPQSEFKKMEALGINNLTTDYN